MSGTTQGRIGSLPRLNFKEFARFGAALAVALGLVAGLGSPAAFAQDADKAASGKDDAANQRAYAAGTRAFESGDMATAERQLTAALSGGGLPNSQMARALYLRGSALRRLGKPARAISDLTTAVWLKGGLSGVDKAKATEERQLAYREAGLGDTPPPVGAAPLDQSPSTPKPGEPPKAKPGTQVAVVGPGGFWNNVSMPSMPSLSLPTLSIPGLSSTPAQPAAAAAAPQQAPAPAQSFAEAPAASQAGQSQGFAPGATAPGAAPPSAPAEMAWQTETAQAGQAQTAASSFFSPQPTPDSTGLNAMPGTSSAAGQAVASADTESSAGGSGSSWGNPLAGTGQAISGFFGNVFGGSGSGGDAQAAGNTPVTTGSTGGDGWGSETTVVTSQTSSMVQRGPESPTSLPWSSSSSTPPVAAAPAAARPTAAKRQVAARPSGGKYKLQVASVRSREEADKLAQTLQGYKAVREGAVSAEVDEAVIGSMGTFYRVRLGPYATAKEPGDLCQTLKPQGFDCLVVTQ